MIDTKILGHAITICTTSDWNQSMSKHSPTQTISLGEGIAEGESQ